MYETLVERLKIAAEWAGKGFRITPSLCLEAAEAIEKLCSFVGAEEEETVAHCNLEENANYIAAILDADADGEVWTPPKEE